MPLAYAKGSGLPHEDIWPKLAAALSPKAKCTPERLIWLRRAAGSYIVETSEAGYSAYRLYHQSMVEYLESDETDRPTNASSLKPYRRTFLARQAADRTGRVPIATSRLI